MQDNIEWYPQHNVTHGRRWTWYGNDMVVYDATLPLDVVKAEALDDLRDRALGRPVGPPIAAVA